jgi:hypothetical protein
MKGVFRVLIAVGIASLIVPATFAASLASDNAGNYTTEWADSGTPNGGSGWGGAWTLSAGGIFFGDSTLNSGGASGGINSGNSRALGLQADSGGGFTSSGVRLFNGALSIGQTFSIDFDNGFIAGSPSGTVGLGLQNSAGNNRVEFFFVGGANNYTVQTGSATDTGIGFTGNGLHLDFVLTGADSMDVKVTPLNPTGSTSTFSVTLGNSGGIDRIRLFDFQGGGGAPNDQNSVAYYNNLAIVPEPSTIVLVGLGLAGALVLRRRKA